MNPVDQIKEELIALIAETVVEEDMSRHYDTIVKRIAQLNEMVDNFEDRSSPQYHLLINICYEYYRLKDKASK
jgi:hypothetical protein